MGEGLNPLISNLHTTLSYLKSSPFPEVPSPQNLKKRASVALVIRISPSFHNWPSNSDHDPQFKDLDSFFAQPWVQHGSPEVLFIKRAARKGDRWTSHIALPGGKRDPEDVDDLAAAVRETWEEVGLDVAPSNDHVLQTGNLPQRVVTTSWGKVPLMVLCPYVFVIAKHGTPPLRLQPTEVASCHWVPLAELLADTNRTVVEEDVSNRLAKQETGVKKWMLKALIGNMVFSAIQLKPSETIRCPSSPAQNAGTESRWSLGHFKDYLRLGPKHSHDPPLLLWGLTLGIVADFLDMVPPHTALNLWNYPTFTPPDVKFAIWALSYRFRKQKAREVKEIQGSRIPSSAVELGLDAVPVPSEQIPEESDIHGQGMTNDPTPRKAMLKSGAVSTMLEGYYDIVRRAIAVALLTRSGVTLVIVFWMIRRMKR